MARIVRFDSFEEYLSENQDWFFEDDMKNHFLIRTSGEVLSQQIGLINFFNILDDNDRLGITAVHVEDMVLLYGDNSSPTMIELLVDALNYRLFKRHMFAGSKQLITSLLATNNAQFEVHKDRNLYRCTAVSDNFQYAPGTLQPGDLKALDVITQMAKAFAEEYDQPGEPVNMDNAMKSGIESGTVYTWIHNEKVCAILQVMYQMHEFPVIGTFYTHPDSRGKGYGASLVHGVTKELLENDHSCVSLSTDAKTPSSNRAFEKAGYKKTGDYFMIYKTA